MKTETPRTSRVVLALNLLALAYFVFWACAPAMSVPPPSPVAIPKREMGAATSVWAAPVWRTPYSETGQYQFVYDGWRVDPGLTWWRWRAIGEHSMLGSTAFIGRSGGLGGGFVWRRGLAERSRFWLGFDMGLGAFWVSVSLPVSVLLRENLALYTHPTLTLGNIWPAQVPVGLRWRGPKGWDFSAEVGARVFPPFLAGGLYQVGVLAVETMGFGDRSLVATPVTPYIGLGVSRAQRTD